MHWFLEHAYVIPLIPAASFFLILFFGKRMPKKGAEIGIAAARHLLRDGAGHQRPVARPRQRLRARRGRRRTKPRRGEAERRMPSPRATRRPAAEGREAHEEFDGRARPEVMDVVVERRRRVHRRHAPRRPRRDDALRRHADLAARARVQHRLRGRRPALHALLRVPLAVHRVDARADHEREHPPAPHLLGAGRPLLVRAHRPLVGGEAELRRRPQGLHHQPRRRRRPDLRRDHPVLRRRADLRHPRDQRDGGERGDQPPRAAGGRPAR